MKTLVLFVLGTLVIPTFAIASLTDADRAFQQRNVPEKAQAALTAYRDLAEQTQRKDPAVLWRLSMGCYFVGLRLASSEETKRQLFFEGKEAGLESVALDPKCAACHFWSAVNMALYGEAVGVLKMLTSLGKITDHLKTSIALDPNYAHGGGYRVLGVIYQRLPGILGGSNAQARDYFRKAIETAPDEPLNFQFLAMLYNDELGQNAEALAAARKGLSIQNISQERVESIEAQADLKKLVARWSAKQ